MVIGLRTYLTTDLSNFFYNETQIDRPLDKSIIEKANLYLYILYTLLLSSISKQSKQGNLSRFSIGH